ncbi:MAG: regulatory protein RecX [Kocuria sp.]|nr:regulatory protein RecX [Kocuria sp.]
MTQASYERRRQRAQQRFPGKYQPNGHSSGAGQQSDEETYEAARQIVLRQLTASAKSRRQLEDKLADCNIPETVSVAVLDRFEQVGLVDDAAFAQAFVRSRSETRMVARPALRRDLQAKGIAPDLIEQALEQRTDDEERQDALTLVRRKMPTEPYLSQQLTQRAQRDRLTRRLVSMLARKGYAPGAAYDAVKQVLNENTEERM